MLLYEAVEQIFNPTTNNTTNISPRGDVEGMRSKRDEKTYACHFNICL